MIETSIIICLTDSTGFEQAAPLLTFNKPFIKPGETIEKDQSLTCKHLKTNSSNSFNHQPEVSEKRKLI